MVTAKTYLIAALAFIVGGSLTFGAIRLLNYDNTTLIFIVGTILGLGAVAWHVSSRGLIWNPTLSEKSLIGLFLVGIALALGTGLHFMFHPFTSPAATLAITPIGVFAFPFVLLGQFTSAWNKQLAAKTTAKAESEIDNSTSTKT